MAHYYSCLPIAHSYSAVLRKVFQSVIRSFFRCFSNDKMGNIVLYASKIRSRYSLYLISLLHASYVIQVEYIVVFYCLASITAQCNECHADAGDGDDMAKCNSELATQNCTSPSIDSCYTLVSRYQSISAPHVIHTGVLRGCVYCPSKKNIYIIP